MLKIFNDLTVFFEDNYLEVNVREYAKLLKVSPPTASTLANKYCVEGLLIKKEYRNNLLFRANRDSYLFVKLCTLYWSVKLKEIVNYVKNELILKEVILFGSLTKSEVTKDSDIDLCFIGTNKNIDLTKFERRQKRKIQTFSYINWDKIPKNLKNNVMRGERL